MGIALLAFAGCSGGGAGDSSSDGKPGDGASGIDLTEYAVHGPLGSGSPVTLTPGPSIEAPTGSVPAGVEVGLRPAQSDPSVPDGWQAISPWYDAASNRSDVRASAAGPIRLSIPMTPPAEAEDHPGLMVLAVLPMVIVPIDGHYDADKGLFEVEILGLPPIFTFCAAFNPTVTRLDSSDVPVDRIWAAATSSGWPTVEWTIDFDEQKLTLAEARDVLRWARQASRTYADAGLLEPFLFRDSWLGMERWHLHLIASDSVYDPAHDTTAADAARRFGRINLAVSDIRRTKGDPIGSGLSILAHELFHAVFHSYQIPSACFNQVVSGVTYCYDSHTGFNEGLATAIGYQFDTGEPTPRPSEYPATLEDPHGRFDAQDTSVAYQNQDFYVFWLRMNGLSGVARYLSALATAVTGTPADQLAALAPYGKALDTADVGIPSTFSEFYHLYAAERGYVRTEMGLVWPSEPYPEEAGKGNTFSPALFPNAHTLGKNDCKVEGDGAECTVTFSAVPPLSARAILVDFVSGDALPSGTGWDEGFSARFKAEAKDGSAAFTVFGENFGEGADEGRVGSEDGSSVTLDDAGKKWTNAKVIVVHGSGEPSDVTVTMNFGVAESSSICEQWVDVYCNCLAAGAESPEDCQIHTQLSLQIICDPEKGQLPEGMTCDEYCAQELEQWGSGC